MILSAVLLQIIELNSSTRLDQWLHIAYVITEVSKSRILTQLHPNGEYNTYSYIIARLVLYNATQHLAPGKLI